MRRFWPLSVCSLCVLPVFTPGWALHNPAAQTQFVGTWHGTLSSRNYASVPVTLIINQGVGVKLTGAVNHISRCIKNTDLDVTTTDSTIVLAGSDSDDNTITFKGSLNNDGTELATTYIVNGSPSGQCETDDGAGTLTKH